MPSTDLRQTVLASARSVVVKIGTQLLTGPRGKGSGIDTDFIQSVAEQIADLRSEGYEITLVSSGAIGCGCAELGLAKRPTDVAEQQAVAAIGQRLLMSYMHDAFAKHDLRVGQVLLTRSDFDDRQRFLNIRNCITHLHQLGCVPILNENDTVAVEEIRFGDNDMLAALTCNALRADAMLLLTAVDGLLDESGELIDYVTDIIGEIGKVSDGGKSDWGTGGIKAKLEAVRLVVEAGEVAAIASGREKAVIRRVLSGEKLGTVFLPADRKLDSRKRWIGLTARPAGTVTIDDGAVRALTSRKKSLLATGISQLTGRFEIGDVLLVRDAKGRGIARGLSNYTSEELRLILGRRSSEFAKLLGRPAYAEVIHRDNLLVLPEAAGA